MSFANIDQESNFPSNIIEIGFQEEEHLKEYNFCVDEISKNIDLLSDNTDFLQNITLRVGQEKSLNSYLEQIQELQNASTIIAKETASLIKKLQRLTLTPPRLEHKKRLVQNKLYKRFAERLERFEAAQKALIVKERGQVDKAKILIQDQDEFSSEELNESQRLLQDNKQTTLSWDLQSNENLIAKREEEIKELENAIVEVNGIFRDLSSLIHDQRFLVEDIESNIRSVSDNVNQGTEELRRAQGHQRKSRNKMCLSLIAYAFLNKSLRTPLVAYKQEHARRLADSVNLVVNYPSLVPQLSRCFLLRIVCGLLMYPSA
ncbi:syntaxin-12-like [Zophobas morio]|uniref:syntaxin-12-like n=1 Tax=Zophobas morio TaxID=2755281 RepID=UPI003083CA88